MDARQRRSRAKLFAAVLELAADRRAEDLSVTEVSRRAGVHRSTFYEHADSPAALLREALQAELDEVRERYLTHLDDGSLPDALRDVTLAVLVHVQQHAQIYRQGLAEGGAIHDFLSGHFQGSAWMLLAQGFLEPPVIAGVPHATIEEASLRYVANGTVGAIAVWLEDPGAPEVFLPVVAALLPQWWHMAPRAGVASSPEDQ